MLIRAQGKFFFSGEGAKFHLKGVTYGPFAPNAEGLPFPAPELLRKDAEAIRGLGANLLRVYHLPSRELLEACRANGLKLLVSIPWADHVDFLSDRALMRQIEGSVVEAVEKMRGEEALFGWLVGNEIPAEMVRWLGPGRVRRWIERLIDIGRKIDPDALFSYSTYPSTEYLLPGNADFICFNVYLHEQKKLEDYLARVQNLSGNRPLVLGEFGMDTLRHTEDEQAELLARCVRSCVRGGLAGCVFFAWTDEWFTGEQDVSDWAFGLTRRDRSPKPAFHALQEFWADPRWLIDLALPQPCPKVSVIVCAFNAAFTLRQCLESLSRLNYPDYEVIVIDDGSTDSTWEIAGEFPEIRRARQSNEGLSVARNKGAALAEGEILAYTDADCMADSDWLCHLVRTLVETDCGGAGGPNIPPASRNWLQACIAAAPGGPNHVLLTDKEAEHVPGCNMAFWRWAFEQCGGFDPQFRTAGDDVDFCWRLQRLKFRISFSPGAVVWHYRRFTLGAFLGQQLGYGEAEALLRRKHFGFFGRTGKAKWSGTVYEPLRALWRLSRPLVYHGVFGKGMFQTVYSSSRMSWATIAGSFDWACLIAFLFGFGFWLGVGLWAPLAMFAATLLLYLPYLSSARVEISHRNWASRFLLAGLALVQPWARGWGRFVAWQRLKLQKPSAKTLYTAGTVPAFAFFQKSRFKFWSEEGVGREQFLPTLLERLKRFRWSYTLDTGWKPWDLQVYGSLWWVAHLATVTEYHGGPRCLTRLRLQARATALQYVVQVALLFLLAPLFFFETGSLAVSQTFALAGYAFFQASLLVAKRRLLKHTEALVKDVAAACGLEDIDGS